MPTSMQLRPSSKVIELMLILLHLYGIYITQKHVKMPSVSKKEKPRAIKEFLK